jgi:hypothetical protein
MGAKMSEIKLLFVLMLGFGLGIASGKLDKFDDMREQYEFGFERGQKTALSINPPSEDLELVCAGLWVGEQNQIYIEREARKK